MADAIMSKSVLSEAAKEVATGSIKGEQPAAQKQVYGTDTDAWNRSVGADIGVANAAATVRHAFDGNGNNPFTVSTAVAPKDAGAVLDGKDSGKSSSDFGTPSPAESPLTPKDSGKSNH